MDEPRWELTKTNTERLIDISNRAVFWVVVFIILVARAFECVLKYF